MKRVMVFAAILLCGPASAGWSQGAGPAPASVGPAKAGRYIGLEAAAKSAGSLPRLRSLLVSHHGELVLERYYGGARATQAANIRSASKSVISALVGIAVSRGLIKGLDQPISDYFPELARDPEPRKREITIEDLLTVAAIDSGRATSPLSEAERFDLVIGITGHAAYHAGQIQLVKKMVG